VTTQETKENPEAKECTEELNVLNLEYKDVAHGSRAELIHIDKVRRLCLNIVLCAHRYAVRQRFNGDQYFTPQSKAAALGTGGDWWAKHVLVLVRYFKQDDPLQVDKTTIEVYSQHLRNILARVIGEYLGISFNTEVRLPMF
jgi:hypothetical protein